MDKIKEDTMKEIAMGCGGDAAPVLPETTKKRGRPRLLNNEVGVKDVVEAIYSTGGRIYEACEQCKMSVSEFYRRWRYNKKVEEALIKARQIGFEIVTDTLLSKALNGDIKAIQTYLRYNPIAKQNDWCDHQTLTLKEEKPLTDDEKQDLAKKLFGN